MYESFGEDDVAYIHFRSTIAFPDSYFFGTGNSRGDSYQYVVHRSDKKQGESYQ